MPWLRGSLHTGSSLEKRVGARKIKGHMKLLQESGRGVVKELHQ